MCGGLQHPHVLPLKGTFVAQDRELGGFSMIFPYMGNRDITRFIDAQTPGFEGPNFQRVINRWVAQFLFPISEGR